MSPLKEEEAVLMPAYPQGIVNYQSLPNMLTKKSLKIYQTLFQAGVREDLGMRQQSRLAAGFSQFSKIFLSLFIMYMYIILSFRSCEDILFF